MPTGSAAPTAGPPETSAPPASVAFWRLRIRHLQLLDALQRLGSLRGAARDLGIAQPAAATLLDDLEYAFGVPLVVRGRTGTTLTQAALAVVARARLAIQEISEARDVALRVGASGGRLRIGASPYLISALLPPMLALLQAALPGVAVEVREGTLEALVADLARGELDAVLGSVDRATVLSSAIQLEATFLGTEPMCVVAGHGHALYGSGQAGIDAVLAGPWVLPHASSHIRGIVDTAVFDLGRAPVVPRVECRGILNMMGMAAATGMLTIAPRAEAQREAWHGRLSIVEAPLPFATPPYAIVIRRYAEQLPQLLVLKSTTVTAARQMLGTAPAGKNV